MEASVPESTPQTHKTGECCLFIDFRENHIPEAIKHLLDTDKEVYVPEACVFQDKLDIGDYIVARKVGGELRERMIFERKSYEDLKDSITGNRWNNQLARLIEYRKNFPSVVIGYIIEGVNENSFFTSIAESLIDLNIHVVYTKNLLDSLKYVLRRRHTLEKSDSLPDLEARQLCKYKEFRGKKTNVNPENFLSEVLKIVPKITPECAKVISDRYTSVADFVLKCTPESLNGLSYQTPKNTEAHLGATRSATVVSMLWAGDLSKRSKIQRDYQKKVKLEEEEEAQLQEERIRAKRRKIQKIKK